MARRHPSARVERRDFWGNEIDIVFEKGKRRIAVEIERGTNKPDFVKEKIRNLRRHYTYVLIIVPRALLSKYNVHSDGKKVFVMTRKQAKEAALQWLK